MTNINPFLSLFMYDFLKKALYKILQNICSFEPLILRNQSLGAL